MGSPPGEPEVKMLTRSPIKLHWLRHSTIWKLPCTKNPVNKECTSTAVYIYLLMNSVEYGRLWKINDKPYEIAWMTAMVGERKVSWRYTWHIINGELIFDFVFVGLPTTNFCIRLVDNKMTDSTQNKVSYLLPYNMVLSFIFVSQKLEKYSGPSSIVGCWESVGPCCSPLYGISLWTKCLYV
jgi:hypothetical protein